MNGVTSIISLEMSATGKVVDRLASLESTEESPTSETGLTVKCQMQSFVCINWNHWLNLYHVFYSPNA